MKDKNPEKQMVFKSWLFIRFHVFRINLISSPI